MAPQSESKPASLPVDRAGNLLSVKWSVDTPQLCCIEHDSFAFAAPVEVLQLLRSAIALQHVYSVASLFSLCVIVLALKALNQLQSRLASLSTRWAFESVPVLSHCCCCCCCAVAGFTLRRHFSLWLQPAILHHKRVRDMVICFCH